MDVVLVKHRGFAVSGALVGASVGVSIAENDIDNTVTAAATGSTVIAQDGDINIISNANQDIEADSVAISITVALAGASGAGVTTKTTIDSDVEAYARDSELTALGNAVNIDADSTHTAHADAVAAAASPAVSVSVVIAEADVGGATRAFADEGMTVNAAEMNVTANSTAVALPDVISVTLALGGAGSGTEVKAGITRTTEAYVGTRSGQIPTAATEIVLTGGPLLISAESVFTATANPVSVGVSVGITVGVTLTEAIINGKTLAYIGESTSVTASQVTVHANSLENATTKTVTVSVGGLAGVDVTSATSRVLSQTEAFVGARPEMGVFGGLTTVNVTNGGLLKIDANADRFATAETTGVAVSLIGISVGVSLPTAEIGGRVLAGMDGTVTLNAGAIDIDATGQNIATSTVLIASVSVVGAGGAGAEANALIKSDADVVA